ncbi:MAG: hypothetical protein J5J00_01480 [Deltaproteobacteria bacterium]|nr:hypothetical protein [Deltaproteobacteria bacterium]
MTGTSPSITLGKHPDLSGAEAVRPAIAEFLQPAADPRATLEKLAMPHQPPIKRMFRDGFMDLMEKMPRIDASQADQTLQVELTRKVLEEMRERVLSKFDELNIPNIPNGEFGRIILAVEEPKQLPNGELVPGTEIVLALWGKGFSSPVHGHAPGYIHEDLIKGAFDVHLYKPSGEQGSREAVYQRTIAQRTPGIFYSEYIQDIGQEMRSALVHNFMAVEQTVSMHYLPEHVRDSSKNGFKVVNTPDSGKPPSYIHTLPYRPGFNIGDDDVRRVSGEEVLKTHQVGDVYLARSQNVAYLGDHYVVITGGLIQKPHGVRPQDVVLQVPRGVATPLDAFENILKDPVVLMKLSDKARHSFYEHHEIPENFRRL